MLERSVLILVRPQGPVNVGLCCRAAKNAGIPTVRLVTPGPEALGEQAKQFAMHATDLLDGIATFEDLPAAVSDCNFVLGTSARRRTQPLPVGPPAAVAPMIPGQGTVALVFGNEAHGLDQAEVDACQALIRLPALGEQTSYNLSHAVAIVTYALAEDAGAGVGAGAGAGGEHTAVAAGVGAGAEPTAPGAGAKAEPTAPPAIQSELEQLERAWLDALEAAGYFRRTSRDRFAPKLRQLIDRLRPASHDVNTLRGMLAQFQLALNVGDEDE